MGTRNLICVIMNNEFKVAQYSQWDGYLDGQGKTILTFIEKQMKKAKFTKALRECRWLTPAEIRATWVEAGDKPDNDSGMVNMEIADKHSMMHPGLSRDTGAEILTLIQDGKFTRNVTVKGKYTRKAFKVAPVRGLQDSSSFASDSLFCEWAYVVDMDKETLEVYTGFQKGKAKGRFAKPPKEKGDKYGPVSLLTTVSFDEIQIEGTDAILKRLQEFYKASGQGDTE